MIRLICCVLFLAAVTPTACFGEDWRLGEFGQDIPVSTKTSRILPIDYAMPLNDGDAAFGQGLGGLSDGCFRFGRRGDDTVIGVECNA